MLHNRQHAFTLAELLIALGILGVIATFTIPKILTAQQDAKKWAIFKEDVAAAQQGTWELVQSGEIELASHSCGVASPIVASLFDTKFNYTSSTGSSTLRTYYITNGSTIRFAQGNSIDFRIDYDGPNAGNNTYGDDLLLFHFNDCTGAAGGGMLPAGKFGLLNNQPAGYIAENAALWDQIWTE